MLTDRDKDRTGSLMSIQQNDRQNGSQEMSGPSSADRWSRTKKHKEEPTRAKSVSLLTAKHQARATLQDKSASLYYLPVQPEPTSKEQRIWAGTCSLLLIRE